MARVRVLGPRDRLEATLAALQDAGTLHLAAPADTPRLTPIGLTPKEARQIGHLRKLARELDVLPTGGSGPEPTAPVPATATDFARWARAARRLQRRVAAIETQRRDIAEARAAIARFEQFVTAFRDLLPRAGGRMRSYQLVLRGEDPEAATQLRSALGRVLGAGFALEIRPLPNGELAALLLVAASEADRAERLLAESGVHELPLPAGVQPGSLPDAIAALAARRRGLDEDLERLEREQGALLREQGPELARGRFAVADRLGELDARTHAASTTRSFVLEGWAPAATSAKLAARLVERLGPSIVVEEVAREGWRAEEVPVILSNPRLFRPFEAVTAMLPLPKYGSIDPTPFTAIFFPMFFGLILGDVGYGLALALLSLFLRRRSRPSTTLRSVAEILGAAAAFSVAFGVAFGEFFGDLGHRWFGWKPLLFNRESALIPFLVLAVSIGFVHVALGMTLGIVNAARRHPREAVGRSAALIMLLLIAVALLAAFDVVPGQLLTPAVIAILIAFPVLVIAEGIIAPIELLSTLSNVLSYARIMALGTASVMMAVVANRLAGTIGSAVVGVLFGLLFHLVNFVLGVFAPAVHALRLHYVEFFGKFYSPGGARYAPFRHWRPDRALLT